MYPTYTRQGLTGIIGATGARQVLNGLNEQFNVQTYGAKGNGDVDDGAAITAAFAAAAAAAPATVVFPKGEYKVGTSTATGASAVDLLGSDINVVGYGATLKLAPLSRADAVMDVSGDRNSVQGLTIDGNYSGSPAGRGDGIYVSGNYNTLLDVKAKNSKTSSGIDFLITDGKIGNTWTNCISYNAGYNGFDDRGDYTTVNNCRALEFGVHGFNKAGGFSNRFTVDGFFATSQKAGAVTGFICDVGQVNGYYVKQAVLRNIIVKGMPNADVFVKIARVHYLEIEGMFVIHDEAIASIKIVEAMKSVKIKDSFFSRIIDFDEVGGVTGSLTAVADNGSAQTRFTCSSHGLLTGDIIYIVSTGYTGLHEVVAVPSSSTFDTNYRVGTPGVISGDFYQAQGQVIFDNVRVGDRVHDALPIGGLRTPRLTMRNCELIADSAVIGLAFKQTYPFTAVERIDVENCSWEFGRDTGSLYVCDAEDASSSYFSSSRKIRWANNTYRNLGSGTLALTRATDMNVLFTSLDGGRDYIVPAGGSLPAGTVVAWQVGDRFWKPDGAAGASPGWICTTAGTFTAGGTFRAMAAIA